ncbi:MAG TPA: LacI family DNA-binding transcriptional regulator [Tepidisphaeraceae bacterium]|jgi:LacI family transcriptional regulator|nr:LacI family DNA-binding transcriptional regulator [Tepidisphaeraceae bacterium]
MTVTLDTIAKHVGLSRQTVAFVLGDRPHLFREETRRRVFAAAQELGYRRNVAAVAMNQGRYNAIGLLQSAVTGLGAVHPNFLAAVLESLREAKMHLSIGQLDDAALTDQRAMPNLMNDWAIDGLIISYIANYPKRLVDILHRYRLPAIWTNVKRDHDSVYPDDYAGARQATELLLAQGHRKIGFVRHGDAVHYSSQDRWSGYGDAMRSDGLEPRRLGTGVHNSDVTTPAWHAELLTSIRAWLQSPDRPSAVVVDDDQAAPLIVHVCEFLGIALGSELSVVNLTRDPSPVLGRVLTTMRIPTGGLGHVAVPLLLQKIAASATDLPSVAVPYKVVHPDVTCRPPVG